jgi:glycosidase
MSQKYPFPDWARDKVIYEVNLRQFTPAGTIKEFRLHLPRLKALGVGILWFMPLQPIGQLHRKGSLGSYYSISDYNSVDPAYGTGKEFCDLVAEIHSMGLYVILDWVANHTSWDHTWVSENPSFYRRDNSGHVFPPFPEWEDVIGLDYSNQRLHAAMIDSMKYWLENTDIDGFRCDMAMLVPVEFWNKARTELQKIKPLLMLAEAEQRELVTEAFDLLYNWNLMHVWNDYANGKYNADELRWRLPSEISSFPKGADNLMFISNHDENSWNGSEIERLHICLEALAVLVFTLPGVPLIYSGMEAGNAKRLSFFDKDEIEWKSDKMEHFYTILCQLRSKNKALWSQQPENSMKLIRTSRENEIFAFERFSGSDSVVIAVNLSNEYVDFQLIDFEMQNGYTDVFTQQEVVVHAARRHYLNPWGFRILVKK